MKVLIRSTQKESGKCPFVANVDHDEEEIVFDFDERYAIDFETVAIAQECLTSWAMAGYNKPTCEIVQRLDS
jgi:hypothetical protein